MNGGAGASSLLNAATLCALMGGRFGGIVACRRVTLAGPTMGLRAAMIHI